MVKKIYVDKKLDADHCLGTFMSESDYDVLLEEDVDVYGPSLDGSCTEDNIVCKFRKNVFSEEEMLNAYEGLRPAAVQSQNRGIAAGPRGERLDADGRGGRDWVTPYQLEVLDWLQRPDALIDDVSLDDIKHKYESKKAGIDETRGVVWLRSKVIAERGAYDNWFEPWLNEVIPLSRDEQRKVAAYVAKKYISETNYAQSVMSGVAGYYGRYPRIPWGRACSYNEKHPDEFARSFPYLRKLDQKFKEMLPQRWGVQRKAADSIDPRFVIDDTVFTTLTVNHNWRTAAHLDAGDLGPGFSNISGLSKDGGWSGGHLVVPEYRAAIAIQPRDLLLVANHTAIHGNTELFPAEGQEKPDRLTVVAYFREDLFKLKSWDYEALRRKFVQERSHNKEHPLYRPLWNGVSPNMWAESEWEEYLKAHSMEDEDGVVGGHVDLESFF